MQAFIVFALARTGSTTLLRLLNCRAGVRCVWEPFNPTNRNPTLAQSVPLLREQGLAWTVRRLWTMCNGFKHVWRWDGWPFEGQPDLNRQILTELGVPVILLHRRNLLRRAISVEISAQMQLWTPNTADDFRRIREHRFAPLDVERLREEIEGARTALDWARGQLAACRIPCRELVYEDLFETPRAAVSQVETVQSLLEFLGAGRASVPETVAMRTVLNPAITGFQNAASYHKIPNIEEVERALGSDEWGHAQEVVGRECGVESLSH